MSKENKRIVEIYEDKAQAYLDNSLEHDRLDMEKAKRKQEKLHSFIKDGFSGLLDDAKIFEIGSADGVNAKFIESLGYDVVASDVATSFIEKTKSTGVKTIKFDVLEDDFDKKYNGVFCWRVFVHFTKDDAKEVIKKVYDALEDGGVFIFNAMNRETHEVDDEWVDFSGEYHMGVERYYSYYREEFLNEVLADVGFKTLSFFKEGGDNKNKWLVYVVEK